MNQYIVYDIESYPNIFTIALGDTDNKQQVAYEISSRKNEFKLILEALLHIKQASVWSVGFNNVNYDYPVIHDLLINASASTPNMPGDELAYSIFLKSDSIIKMPYGKFTSVWETDVKLPQLDLMKINHFDNVNRRTSLKCLEFKMRSQHIQDLPFTPGQPLLEEQMDGLIEYNKKDVRETAAFFNLCKPAIEFREGLCEKMGMNVMNFSDSKLGAEFMVNKLEAHMGDDVCYVKKGRSKKPKQTKRPEIILSEVLDDRVAFITQPFNAIKEWISLQTITETKGVFTDLDLLDPSTSALHPYIDEIQDLLLEEAKHKSAVKKVTSRTEIIHKETGEVLYTYANAGSAKKIKDIRSAYTEDQLEYRKIKHTLPKLCIPFDNGHTSADGEYTFSNVGELLLVYGLGGLHGSVLNKEISSDEEWLIIDADVTGYYPNTAITTNTYPEHIGPEFVPVYKGLIAERDQYDKKSVEGAGLKLACNSVYGKTNDKYSPFYDPQATMQITLNGQLFLSMLIEQLKVNLGQDVELIQANTDGITVRVRRTRGQDLALICKRWCDETELKLEYVAYSKMFIKDVNNYLAVKLDGSIKTVGCYKDPVPSESNMKGDWAKNHNHLVVYKTAIKCMLDPSLDAAEEVRNHQDIFDFMFYFKAGGATFRRLEMHYELNSPQVIQKRSRFLVTNNGGKLFKVLDPSKGNEDERYTGEKAAWLVTECNDLTPEMYSKDHWDINYDFYISEVKKIMKFEEVK